MLSKLATQSFNILRLIARNPIFLRPKVPYFNVSRLSRLKMTENDPKWPKVAQIWPQMAQEWQKMAQKWPQTAQKLHFYIWGYLPETVIEKKMGQKWPKIKSAWQNKKVPGSSADTLTHILHPGPVKDQTCYGFSFFSTLPLFSLCLAFPITFSFKML